MIYEIEDARRHTPRVARKRQARMQHILRAAFAIAREEGRDALTLGRLAERLDYTPGALYRYFPSKDVLVAELQRSVIAWLGVATRDCIAAADDAAGEVGLSTDARALLPVVVTAFGFEHFARTAPVEFGLLSMYLSTPEFALPDDEAARVFEAAWSSLDDLATLLARAGEAGVLAPGDAHERAVALWAGLQGVVQTRKLARSGADRIDPTAIARGLVRSLLVGFGADPATLDAVVAFLLERRLAEPAGSVDDLLEAAAA